MGSNKKSKKRKRAVESEEDYYAVEYILKARVAQDAVSKTQDDQWDYYVKWAGYGSDDNTWEPSRNLVQCERLVQSFWQAIGWDNEDYTEGSEVVPSIDWIATEKSRFWQNLTPHERETYTTKEMERRAQASHAQQARALVAAGTVPDLSSPEQSPEPVKRPKLKKNKNKKPRVNKEDTGKDDDMPPKKKRRSTSRTIPAKRKQVSSSSDEEPLDQRQRRLGKVRKLSTPVELTTSSSKPSPQPEIISLDSPPTSPRPNKGKQKAIEETPPDSPSSLFSASSSEEEVMEVPSHRRPEPQRKSSKILSPATATNTNTKTSPIVPSKVPKAVVPNPYMRSPDLPLAPVPMTGISTKQRLSMGASLAINPKEAREKQLQPIRTMPSTKAPSSLAQLKFNKSKSSSTNIVLNPNETTVESPTINPSALTLNALNAPANKDQSPPLHIGSFRVDSPAMMESHQIFQSHSPTEADDFLSSMVGSLPGFGSPLEPPLETPAFETTPFTGFLTQRKTSTLPKIPKQWKWEGLLFILKSNDQEELVGSVVCTNVTQPKLKGMRIPLTFDAMDRLNFISFHDSSDVLIFLGACKSADQLATLSARDSESLTKFKPVAEYLAKHQQVLLVPVWYDNNVVGHLLVFPPACKDILQHLEVPSQLVAQAKDGLIVSLHGWNLKYADQQKESRLPVSDIVPANTSLAPAFEKGRAQDGNPGPHSNYTASMRTNVVFHFALRVLNFSTDLFDWLTASHRTYAVYHEQERRDDKSEPVELRMLKAVMKGCQAQEWKHNESKKEHRLRIVFVHVGSVNTFTRSPLTQKRKTLDIRFYSYGTDGNTPRTMWGLREIYPIGGVVTFYPSSFTEDYAGSIRLIRNIHDHPLWMAFISPTCLGYLAKLACKGQDPLVVYETEGQSFALFSLLKLIAEGEIALLTAPPESTASIGRLKSWARNYCRTINPLDALSIGMATFNSVCANNLPADWVFEAQNNANADIVAVQRHPAILYHYRRFVVVKGPKDQATSPNSVELVTTQQFTFQDDYFKRKS